MTTENELSFTPEARATVEQMFHACNRVGREHGDTSPLYRDMVLSLNNSLANVFRLGGRISRDGPLSLFGSSFIAYGVIFHRTDRADDRDVLTTAVPGTWSVHS